jgi:hypothetical protein
MRDVADRRSTPPLSSLDREPEASEDVASSNNDKRVIVRRRTQQLVYLELGRDNGGVMLNLSEDGCGFQAITPVKIGETRFGFQISGGRRIAGEAEVVWVDDVGIMGGLRFLNLPLEARKQIRRWLEETNAPEEYGAFEPAAQAPHEGARRGSREYVETAEAADPARPRDYRQGATYGAAGSRGVEQEVAPPPPAWAHVRAASTPVVQGDQFPAPIFHDDGSYAASRPRSVALWRGIAALAVATAIAALVVAYQRDVGTSLIWLGETLTGKTKASQELPETKPAPVKSNPPALEANSPAPQNTGGDSTVQKPEDRDPEQATTTSHPAPEAVPPTVTQPRRLEASVGTTERQQSMLERQGTQLPKEDPEVWNANESVESLWGAVQGGSVAAERSLAERFVRGEGVAKNCDQAKVLLRAAANRGSREARLRLYELETGGCQ